MNHISKWMETYFGILYQCVNGSAMLLTAERPSRTRIVGVLGVWNKYLLMYIPYIHFENLRFTCCYANFSMFHHFLRDFFLRWSDAGGGTDFQPRELSLMMTKKRIKLGRMILWPPWQSSTESENLILTIAYVDWRFIGYSQSLGGVLQYLHLLESRLIWAVRM